MKYQKFLKYLTLIVFMCLNGIFSCNIKVQDDRIQHAQFFELGQLIDEQTVRLGESKALLYKQAFIDNEYSDQLLMNEACQWAKELEIFKEADLNIPALTKSYSYTLHQTDTGVLHTWKSLYPQETKVDEFMVFKNHQSEPLIIKSTMKYGNYLYKTLKNFELNLDYTEDQVLLLKEYKIEGWKKLLKNDTTFYSLVGEIR